MKDRREFWTATGLTGLQAGMKMAANFTIGKLAALWLGPAGLGTLGQFQTINFLLQNLANAAIQNGVVRNLVATDDHHRRARIARTSLAISVVGSVLFGVLAYLLSPWLNARWLGLDAYRWVFGAAALGLLCNSLMILGNSVLNGIRAYRALTFSNIIQSLLTLALFVPLGGRMGLQGALLAMALFPAPTLLAMGFLYRRRLTAVFQGVRGYWHAPEAKALAHFSVMTLVGIAGESVMKLLVRDCLASEHGGAMGGYWEAMIRIGNLYILFLTMIFSTYIMPRYAACKSGREAVDVMKFTASRILPMFALIIGGIVLVRSWLTGILFTPDFAAINDAMPWHMAGDIVRTGAWLFAYLLVAQRKTAAMLTADLSYNVLMTSLVYSGMDTVVGAGQAHLLSSVLFAAVLGGAVWYHLRKDTLITAV